MKAALWLQVSTNQQDTAPQRLVLEEAVTRVGDTVVKVYDQQESAYQPRSRRQRGFREKALEDLKRQVRIGAVDVVYMWSLDRLTREGAAAMLTAVHEIYKAGGRAVSLQESWLDATSVNPLMRDLLLAVTGMVGAYESARHSERVKAGQARLLEAGGRLGKPLGAKDKRKRASRKEADRARLESRWERR